MLNHSHHTSERTYGRVMEQYQSNTDQRPTLGFSMIGWKPHMLHGKTNSFYSRRCAVLFMTPSPLNMVLVVQVWSLHRGLLPQQIFYRLGVTFWKDEG